MCVCVSVCVCVRERERERASWCSVDGHRLMMVIMTMNGNCT